MAKTHDESHATLISYADMHSVEPLGPNASLATQKAAEQAKQDSIFERSRMIEDSRLLKIRTGSN